MDTITRIKNKTGNFTIVSNEIFQRSDLSARAKGIFIYIMTLPNNWKLYKSELYNHFTEGITAIDTAFSELEKLGYITKERHKGEGGKFSGWDYTIREEVEKTDPMENRPSVKPISGNPQLLSTDSVQSTDKIQKTDKKDNIYIPPQDAIDTIYCAEIISHLNEKTGSRYRLTSSVESVIKARLSEGFTKDDFLTVIDIKVASWKGTEFAKYLRPDTLFRASKFQGYLNEKPFEKTSEKPSQRTLGNDARWAQYWAEEDAKNAGQK
jgi:uncharacterized phage protein (TIGR02220 family)